MAKLELYYPLKPWYLTQKFGETAFLGYYQANGVNFVGHNGLDAVVHHGDPVRAAHDGYAYYQIDQNQGHGVVLITKDKFEYGTEQVFFKTIYWHLCDPVKEPKYKSPIQGNDGKEVKAGDILGYCDSTGLSTGTHLHFGLKPVARNEANNAWGNVMQNNGYQGAIDSAPYFNGKYAEDINKPLQSPTVRFMTDMSYGQTSPEIERLQAFLSELGYFNHEPTSFFGRITQKAVYDFQNAYNISPFTRHLWKGHYCGPSTRKKLNELLDQYTKKV